MFLIKWQKIFSKISRILELCWFSLQREGEPEKPHVLALLCIPKHFLDTDMVARNNATQKLNLYIGLTEEMVLKRKRGFFQVLKIICSLENRKKRFAYTKRVLKLAQI